MGMNLNQLRYLAKLAETNSFKEAAERCCVTQPTLSNGIAQLEEEIGGKLFRRTTRSVELTQFGGFIIPLAQAVLDAKEELEKSAKTYFTPEAKVLRIGLSPLISHDRFPSALNALKQSNTWSEVFLKHCFMNDLEERLINETLDLVLMPKQSKSNVINSHFLYREPLFYIPPQADITPTQTSQAIEVSELSDKPIILTNGCGLSDVIADLFVSQNATLTPYPGQALNYTVVTQWAELGLAGGILPKSHIPEGTLSVCPLLADAKPAMIDYQATWNNVQPLQEILKSTAELIAGNLSNIVPIDAQAQVINQ